jgi:stage V sporulation protein G
MVITEVRIKLVEQNTERLLAFCSVTFDHAFVVRDLKLIEGARGIFVAMPSRKLTDRCMKCQCKNHMRARFCNGCGTKLDETRMIRDHDGRAKLHADIAHPIHAGCRVMIESSVVKSYHEEKEKAKLPGYVCRYDEYDAGDYEDVPSGYGHLVKAHAPHEMTPKSSHIVQKTDKQALPAGVKAKVA